MRSTVRFRLPPELEATAPPESRGVRRDHVRLLAVDRATGAVGHHRGEHHPPPGVGLGKKPDPVFLKPGDVMDLSITGLGAQRQRVCAYPG